MKFDELNINNNIKKALSLEGFENMTKVQEMCIPHILSKMDLVGHSKTGSGKTAAFLVPIIQNIDTSKNHIQALILCPTRELTIQVYEQLKKYTKFLKDIKTLCVYGGESIEKQIIPLRRGVHIIVATVGRVIDHIRRKTIKLNNVSVVVLDEADEMLKMGFEEDIEKIVSYIPEDRQTLLFSATFNDNIKKVAKKYLKDPKIIEIKEDVDNGNNIKQMALEIKTKMKDEALRRLLEYYSPEKCAVFCNTKKMAEEVKLMLNKSNFTSMAIYSDIRQEQRSFIIKGFKEGKFNILVATDVAARGLDIPNLDLVINYDLPKEEELYIHRIGRTGRNGANGISVTFVVGKEKNRLEGLEKLSKSKIEMINLPTLSDIEELKNKDILIKIKEIISNEDYSDLSLYEKICKDNNHNYKEISKALYSLIFNSSKNVKKTQDDGKYVTLFFSLGRDNLIKAKDIVGAIANNTALLGNQIGKIEVMDKYSFAQVPSKYVDEVIFKLNGSKIKNKKIEVQVSDKEK